MRHQTLVITMAAALVLTGCETPDGRPDRTGTGVLAGGAIGATSGALIGGSRGRGGEGAVIGGVLGAIAGGLIGNSLDQNERSRLREQAPQTYTRIEQGQPLGLADVKAMAQAGVGDEVIISQIRSTHTSYRMSAADIIDLHNSGVSQKVIDFMINTQNSSSAAPAPAQTVTVVHEEPPPLRTDIYVRAPGPRYVWCGGEWEWRGRWAWVDGHWDLPPYPSTVWIGGSWSRGSHGWQHSHGHWR